MKTEYVTYYCINPGYILIYFLIVLLNNIMAVRLLFFHVVLMFVFAWA